MSHTSSTTTGVSLFRIFAAMFYDAIALSAIWFFAALVVVIGHKGQAIDAGSAWFTAYLLVCAYAYFAFCWIRSGQTLGMKSWKIRLVVDDNSSALGVKHTVLRYIGAAVSLVAFGSGYWWTMLDPKRRSWHDRLSRTRIVDASLDHD